MTEPASIEQYKQQAAERALEFVVSGMIVGLGTGSTAIYATRRLGQLLRDGLLHDIVGVPTSAATAVAAERVSIPLLGMRKPVPVEVVRFGWRRQAEYLHSLGAEVTLRVLTSGAPFVTDQGNLILDCAFGPIADTAGLAASIRARAGIVEHGLFVGL